MNFSEALTLMEEGKKVTDGKITLTRKLIDLPLLNKKGEAVVSVNDDGSFSQIVPCQEFFDSTWEVIE